MKVLTQARIADLADRLDRATPEKLRSAAVYLALLRSLEGESKSADQRDLGAALCLGLANSEEFNLDLDRLVRQVRQTTPE